MTHNQFRVRAGGRFQSHEYFSLYIFIEASNRRRVLYIHESERRESALLTFRCGVMSSVRWRLRKS